MKRIVLLISILVFSNISFSNEVQRPLIVVYADDLTAVQMATVSVTNTCEDAAILITSVEFIGQLPETRYFYHGIAGRIDKTDNNYIHGINMQALSLPVGSCFILPGQSTSWKRPLRILDDGYEVKIKWREIPHDKINTNIWYETNHSTNIMTILFEPLLKDKEPIYCNISAAQGHTPNVIIEGDFKEHELVYHVKSDIKYHSYSDAHEEIPDDSYIFNIYGIADSIVVTKEKVIFREFNRAKKEYEIIDSPNWSPLVMDFLYYRERTKEKTVPCILSPKDFNDLIEVKLPSADRYNNPGITQVPFNLIGEILKRAQERNLDIQLKCIDPNSLGKMLVITIKPKVKGNERRGQTL